MPTIKDKLYFNYNGISSNLYNLINVSLNNGMFEESFVSSIELTENKIRGNEKPYFQGISQSPIEFDLTLAFEDDYTDSTINDVVMWLFQDYYKPFYFIDNPDKIFYCMPISDSNIVHTGLKQGYITIKMRCDSPYIYSPVFISENFDLSNGQVKTIELFNDGHTVLYPEISIDKIDAGNIKITNRTDSGMIFEILDLTDKEGIYIDTEREIIDTDIIGVYRYDKVIGNYPKLLYGRNLLEIEGKCTIQFRYQNRYKF